MAKYTLGHFLCVNFRQFLRSDVESLPLLVVVSSSFVQIIFKYGH